MASYKITAPDGQSYRVNAPDDATPDQVMAYAQKSFKMAAAPTDRQKLLSSAPMRVAKGLKDPVDGAAQLLESLLPKGVTNAVNKAADFVGGEGTFLGDVLGIKGATGDQLTNDMRAAESEYGQAREVTGQSGLDGLRLLGNVASPVNMTAAKFMPTAKIGDSMKMLAAKGAAAGAAGAATQPALSGDFATEKATQIGVGAATGGVLTPALSRASESLGKMYREWSRNGATSKTPERIAFEIKSSLARDDIDVGQIPKAVMSKLSNEVNQALRSGQEIDAPALLRKLDFDRVGVKPMLGQLTRDPTQFTREMNLRGVQGVGEPIANRLNEQSGQIASKFRQGLLGAPDEYAAGAGLLGSLRAEDKKMSAGVRSAYDAFKSSTGKDLDVPLQGLSQGYAQTLRDFGDTIPGSVRKQFDELGLLGGKQMKTFGIDDAENLIKSINKNYNPMDRAQSKALDELRGHVQNSILDVTDSGAGMEAATLANMARDTARQRFNAIDSTPALKAAINGAEPDKFVKKYVIGGSVRELKSMADMVGPGGRATMGQQMMRHLQNKAFGANAAGDGMGRQASLNSELQSIGREKLQTIFGADKADELFALGRVMAYIQQQPAGSAVNNSNTGAMVASLLGKIGGTVKGMPYINDFVIKPIQTFADRGNVSSALSANLPKQATQLDAQTIQALARLTGPVPVASGAALGYSVR